MKRKARRLFYFVARYLQLILVWIILQTVRRDLLKQDIWLIREKRDEARDNGYHFFKYLRENHPEINVYYAITPDSPDRNKVAKYGGLINADGWKHSLYFLAAKFSISSQPYGAYPFRFSGRMMNYVQKLCNKKQKVIFLQHGIIIDEFPVGAFGYHFCNIDYFVSSTQREYDFIRERYKYPDYAIGCVGLARFDFLHTTHIVEDKILVMPTWRRWLENEKKEQFCNSDYFRAYAELMQDQLLTQFLRDHNYKLVFYMHYKFQPYVETFGMFANDVIVIADSEHFDVQELLMTSKMMITDYSSVFFDFAYMNKPVIYYQFDKQRFRQTHYADKGYFSYENDGFGPCFEDLPPLKQYVFDMIQNQCNQPDKYFLRVSDFFTMRDSNNCKRTYEAIKALGNC